MMKNDKGSESIIKQAIKLPASVSALKPLEEPGLDLMECFAGPALPGNFPMPMAPRTEWHYVLVTGGQGRLHYPDKTWTPKRGDFFIAHPSCLRGCSGQKGERLYRILWKWRTPPLIPFIKPEEGQYIHIKMPEQTIWKLQRLSAACLRELQNIDNLIQFKLYKLRIEIELLLAQGRNVPDLTKRSSSQFDLALNWMEEHLAEKGVIGSLCRYLAVSPATLNRLFRQHVKISPAVYLQNLKIQNAKKLLREGNLLVKEVAYYLGYKNPNNFSRAFKRQTGIEPHKNIAPSFR